MPRPPPNQLKLQTINTIPNKPRSAPNGVRKRNTALRVVENPWTLFPCRSHLHQSSRNPRLMAKDATYHWDDGGTSMALKLRSCWTFQCRCQNSTLVLDAL